jgi:hypothetical protein
MTNTEYMQFRRAVEDAFSAVYRIDPASLAIDQKTQHQQCLSATYLAVIRAENASFAQLTDKTKAKIAELASLSLKLQQDLAGLKKAGQTLQLVSDSIGIFSRIAKLLG